MNKLAENEDGLSLVELLAVLAIGSMILLFISTIHIFIQNQSNTQSADVKGLTDITVAMRAITKDIRSDDMVETSEDFKQLIISVEGKETAYHFENEILKKNRILYIYDMEYIEVTSEASKIKLKMISLTGKREITEIVIWGGK